MTFPLSSTHHRAGACGGHKIWGKTPPPPLWGFTGHMTKQRKTLMKIQKIHVGNTILLLQRWSKSSPTAFAQKYMPSKTKRHHLLVLPETKWWSQKRCFPPKTRALPGSAPSPRQSFLKAYLKKTLKSLRKLLIILFKYSILSMLFQMLLYLKSLRKLLYVISSCFPTAFCRPHRDHYWHFGYWWCLMCPRKGTSHPWMNYRYTQKNHRISVFQCLLANIEETCIVTKFSIIRRNMYSTT